MAASYTSATLAVIESAYIKTNPTASAYAIDLAVVNAITHGTDAIGIIGIFSGQLAA